MFGFEVFQTQALCCICYLKRLNGIITIIKCIWFYLEELVRRCEKGDNELVYFRKTMVDITSKRLHWNLAKLGTVEV